MGKYQLREPVEAHQHTGSSTSAARLQRWIDSGEFKGGAINTRDLTVAELFDKTTQEGFYLEPQDWLVKATDGSYSIFTHQEFQKYFVSLEE